MRRVPWLLALVLLTTCSPLVRVEVRFLLPAAVTLDRMRFHASVLSPCDPHNLNLPRAQPPEHAPAPNVAGRLASRIEGNAFVVELAERASHCYVHMTAWYDGDGDGRVGRGDHLGSMPAAIEARDRGPCGGNLTTTAPVALLLVE